MLDCQPLLSASVMDRTIQVLCQLKYIMMYVSHFLSQLEKKNTSEFTTIENTMEVQSLQMIGFLFSVCHTVLFVQVIYILHCIIVSLFEMNLLILNVHVRIGLWI